MHIQGHSQSSENWATAAGLDRSPGVTFIVTLAFTLGRLWSHSFPLIRSWLEGANPSEQHQKPVTTWQTPAVVPSNQGESTNLYHTINRESHSANTFVLHPSAHRNCTAKLSCASYFTPRQTILLSFPMAQTTALPQAGADPLQQQHQTPSTQLIPNHERFCP